MNGLADCIEIHTQQASAAHALLHDALHVNRRHTLESARDRHRLDGLIQRPGDHRRHRTDRSNAADGHGTCAPVDGRQAPLALSLLTAILFLWAEHVSS
jgi:hypothetical protein